MLLKLTIPLFVVIVVVSGAPPGLYGGANNNGNGKSNGNSNGNGIGNGKANHGEGQGKGKGNKSGSGAVEEIAGVSGGGGAQKPGPPSANPPGMPSDYLADRNSLYDNFDPDNCWANGEQFRELLNALHEQDLPLNATYLGIDFNTDYYGFAILDIAMKQCPHTNEVWDQYFVYDCKCVDGEPRLQVTGCRDGSEGENLPPGVPGGDFYSAKKTDWMGCVENDDGTYTLKKFQVQAQKTMGTSQKPKTDTKHRVARSGHVRRKRSAEYPSTTYTAVSDATCSSASEYVDSDEEFIYECSSSAYAAEKCVVEDESETTYELDEDERITYDQTATIICEACDSYLCSVYQDIGSEIYAVSS